MLRPSIEAYYSCVVIICIVFGERTHGLVCRMCTRELYLFASRSNPWRRSLTIFTQQCTTHCGNALQKEAPRKQRVLWPHTISNLFTLRSQHNAQNKQTLYKVEGRLRYSHTLPFYQRL